MLFCLSLLHWLWNNQKSLKEDVGLQAGLASTALGPKHGCKVTGDLLKILKWTCYCCCYRETSHPLKPVQRLTAILQISGSTFFGRGNKRFDGLDTRIPVFNCLGSSISPLPRGSGEQQDFLGQRVSTEDTSVCHTKQKWDIMLSKRFTKWEQINRNGNLKTTLLTWVKDEAITRVNCDFKGDSSKLWITLKQPDNKLDTL